VPNRPDIKVFNPPDQYPIRGVDISRFEGEIDWLRVSKLGISFAYIRATGPVSVDGAFSKHWEQTQRYHISHGAYHVFSYCQPVAAQFDLITRTIPAEADALPIAIDFEKYPPGIMNTESECATKLSDDKLRDSAIELAEQIQSRYGKVPVIYGASAVLSRVLDDRFNRYMIWLASYTRGDASHHEDLGLRGNNPWTLWQYTGTATVDGIGMNVDLNVFFGTHKQFELFKEGKENVALESNVR
jgi:GH25 family lysozyme M1 (1,4-beta-N-acetylmuramidase)